MIFESITWLICLQWLQLSENPLQEEGTLEARVIERWSPMGEPENIKSGEGVAPKGPRSLTYTDSGGLGGRGGGGGEGAS